MLNAVSKSTGINKEASRYATGAKIHLVYGWILNHCFDLNEKHKAILTNEVTKTNQTFTEARKRSNDPENEPLYIDPKGFIEELENVFYVRSFPPMKYGIKVLEYAINEAFYKNLMGVPGFYLNERLFRLNLPTWHDGLIQPYFDNGLIIGLFLYRSVKDSMPHLLSSHDLLLGKRFIEPKETNRELFI